MSGAMTFLKDPDADVSIYHASPAVRQAHEAEEEAAELVDHAVREEPAPGPQTIPT